MGGDHLFQRDEADRVVVGLRPSRAELPAAVRRAVRGDADQPRYVLRDLHPREPLVVPAWAAYRDREVERQPADVGERVGRVDRERGQHGEDLLVEVPVQALLLDLGQIVPQPGRDAGLRQRGCHHLAEAPGVTFVELGR